MLKKIVVIDDDPNIHMLLKVYFDTYSHGVVDASYFLSFEQFEQTSIDQHFDVIIFDYKGSKLPGDKIAIRLSELKLLIGKTLVLFTAQKINKQEKQLLQSLGIEYFLNKSVTKFKFHGFLDDVFLG